MSASLAEMARTIGVGTEYADLPEPLSVRLRWCATAELWCATPAEARLWALWLADNPKQVGDVWQCERMGWAIDVHVDYVAVAA